MPTMYYVWQTNRKGNITKYLGKMDQTEVQTLKGLYAKFGKEHGVYTEVVE